MSTYLGDRIRGGACPSLRERAGASMWLGFQLDSRAIEEILRHRRRFELSWEEMWHTETILTQRDPSNEIVGGHGDTRMEGPMLANVIEDRRRHGQS